MTYLRYGLWGLALLFGLWWAMDRGEMDGNKMKQEEPVARPISKAKLEGAMGQEEGKDSRMGGSGKAKEGFDGSMETGSGDEIPGQKILRFKNRAAYERFLKGAPAGMVLGQIDG
ncbi:MAG TPA: hypothetical protein DEO44_06805, partial [Verrucomicrobia subdivision 6 bacterium]|nr:hypothetical protein [Verrucomicrobia subdivision 6 bacterium]